MKNKIRFILPRLIGLTVLAGLLALVIGLIFKLLLVGTLLAGAGMFIASRFKKRQAAMIGNERRKGIAPAYYEMSSSAIRPQYSAADSADYAIIPIR